MTFVKGKLRSPKYAPIVVAILAVLGMILLLGGTKGLQFVTMAAAGENFSQPPETVTTATVSRQNWPTTLQAVGSLTAIQGVELAAEMSGQITEIVFEPGSKVAKGDILVQQNIASEKAQLRAAQAVARLAKTNMARSKELLTKNLNSQSEYDAAVAQYDEAIAHVDNIQTIIEKKTIRAPFAGRVGTQNIYPGQHLREGDPVVSLQSLESLRVDFNLPQSSLRYLSKRLAVTVTTDALPGQSISGTVSAVDSMVDPTTRNIRLQATIPNPEEKLLPGLFVNVSVVVPEDNPVLTIPATAVLHASYGASVFTVSETKNEQDNGTTLKVKQQFVKLGKSKGDFIAIESGLTESDTVVSTGAFKLHNDQSIVVNNDLAPEFKLDPNPEDS